MLSEAKPILEARLLKILYDAYMTQFSADPDAGNCNTVAMTSFQNAAVNFSKKASKPVADAIYKFVKGIGITVNSSGVIIAPPMPPTLPGGPCTGTIPQTNITIS